MIDYKEIITRYNITPVGVIHIGGYHGTEDISYQNIGFRNRLFIEAQPDTFLQLQTNLEGRGAFCEEVAISNCPGTIDFHIATNGMSSSILPFAKHLDIYPQITETTKISVEATRLDDLIMRKYANIDFNFLNVDVQGAELFVLQGAIKTLEKMDFLNLEVNFDELYQGAPHISKLDIFLSQLDFTRVDTYVAHPTWGDAIWINNKFTKV